MTTPRKPRPQETETDRRRTEKENLTVTVDLSRQMGVKPTDCVNNLFFQSYCVCALFCLDRSPKLLHSDSEHETIYF